jgi:predicted phosphodiesterase
VRRAIISDIHGNYEALVAVLAHIDSQNVDQIACLGDIIGYGPNPVECLDLVIERCDWTILGNHDKAAMYDPQGFNPVAMRAIYWTRDAIEKAPGGALKYDQRWDFIGSLPTQRDEGKFLFVHGSPRDPTNEYVFPWHAFEGGGERITKLLSRVEQYCFQGHTHLPGVFLPTFDFRPPEELDYVYKLGDEKVMINVGSVGQPRDDDPRSCYVIIDTDSMTVEFHRVKYEVEKTRSKIYAIDQLENMLGDRLVKGS